MKTGCAICWEVIYIPKGMSKKLRPHGWKWDEESEEWFCWNCWISCNPPKSPVVNEREPTRAEARANRLYLVALARAGRLPKKTCKCEEQINEEERKTG
jgi:hypothetical protein